MSNYAPPRRPPLERDQEHKMVAGVCAGLGRHLDIDPVVFRIVLTVLTLFGGLGILAYAAAWLLIPATGESASEAQRLTSGTNVYVAAAVGVLLLLGFMAFVGFVAHSFNKSIPLVFVVAAAVGIVIWHRETSTQQARRPVGGNRPGWNRPDWTDPSYPADPSAQPQAWWQRPVAVRPEPEPQPQPQPQPQPTHSAPDAEQSRPEQTHVQPDGASERSAAENFAPAQHVAGQPAPDQSAADQPESAHPVSGQPLAETPDSDIDNSQQIHEGDAENALAKEPEATESHEARPAPIEDHVADRIESRIGSSIGEQVRPDEDRIEDAVEVDAAHVDTADAAEVADVVEGEQR